MEDLIKAVVSSLRYESYDRIKEQLNFTVVFASLRTVWYHSRERMAFAVQGFEQCKLQAYVASMI